MKLRITLSFPDAEAADFERLRWVLRWVVALHADTPENIQITVEGVAE